MQFHSWFGELLIKSISAIFWYVFLSQITRTSIVLIYKRTSYLILDCIYFEIVIAIKIIAFSLVANVKFTKTLVNEHWLQRKCPIYFIFAKKTVTWLHSYKKQIYAVTSSISNITFQKKFWLLPSKNLKWFFGSIISKKILAWCNAVSLARTHR